MSNALANPSENPFASHGYTEPQSPQNLVDRAVVLSTSLVPKLPEINIVDNMVPIIDLVYSDSGSNCEFVPNTTINFNFKHQDVLVEDYTRAQVQQLIKYRPYRSAIISMMPDCHPGKVTPVGFTAIVNKNNGIMPMALGGDIGCGIVTVNIGDRLKKFDPRSLDVFIRKNIPSGWRQRQVRCSLWR